MVRANAIITRRNIVRASESGYSYSIDSRGQILSQSLNSSNFLRKVIEIEDKDSFYVKYQEMVDFLYSCLLILLLFYERANIPIRFFCKKQHLQH